MEFPTEDDATARVDLVPGRLAATVFVHAIDSREGRLDCWTYASRGLRSHGQKELVLTLVRRPDEAPDAYPRDPLDLFAAVLDVAAGGRIVDEGDLTELGPAGFLGRPGIRALGYLRPDPPLVGTALQAILLTDDERQVAQSHGLTRVAARLGDRYRHYPCPPWSERDRPSVITPGEAGGSLLERLARVGVRGAAVLHLPGAIELSLPAEALPALRDGLPALPPAAPLALLTGFDQRANAWLAWAPQQHGPYAISPDGSDGSRLGGCFCAFLPDQPGDGWQVFEDGLVVSLTPASWARVREALLGGTEATVRSMGPDGTTFALGWGG
ncbi:MAG: hypothetical protein A2X23_03945 [Chloroflexi bacterium GWC2_73_18]|nr:MAG: hypothetical protein A2X23_03945 [Chloroflexi bacterium GWC2_73_18]